MKAPSPPDPEFDALLSGFVDGVLSEDERAALSLRLKQDPGARREYLAYTALDGDLYWDYALAATERGPVRESPAPIPATGFSFSRWIMPVAAAAVLLVGLFAFLQGIERPIVTVEFADGAVYRPASGTGERTPGRELAAGTLIVESPSGSAELVFRDGTRITLAGESEMAFAAPSTGKSIRVLSGSVTANVTPQPEDKPLRILTSTAEVEVVGTVLTVGSRNDETDVTVEEGLVRLRRLTDGQTVEVPARHGTVATLRSGDELAVRRSDTAGTRWKTSLEDVTKSDTSIGSAGEPVYGAVPYIAGRDNEDMKLVRNGISFNGNLAGLTERSEVRIRYRGTKGPTLFLSLKRESGKFGGNFEYDLHHSEDGRNPEGWTEVTIPIHAFEPVAKIASRGFQLEGNTVTKVLVSVGEEDSLELLSVEISGDD